MPRKYWECFVCEALNPPKAGSCKLCSAPLRLSRREVLLRRAEWEGDGWAQVHSGVKFGLASKVAFLLIFDIVVVLGFLVFLGLFASDSGTVFGAVPVIATLLAPAPFLALVWVVVVVRSRLGKR